MAALDRPTSRSTYSTEAVPRDFVFPVKADAKIYIGAALVLEGGFATPAKTATGLKSVGMATQTKDATGLADGDLTVSVRRGVFPFTNSGGGDAITQAEAFGDVFWVDDDTVAKTDGTGTRSVAGRMLFIDDEGIWVEVGV